MAEALFCPHGLHALDGPGCPICRAEADAYEENARARIALGLLRNLLLNDQYVSLEDGRLTLDGTWIVDQAESDLLVGISPALGQVAATMPGLSRGRRPGEPESTGRAAPRIPTVPLQEDPQETGDLPTCVIEVGHPPGTSGVWRDANNPATVVCDRHRHQYDERPDLGPFDWQQVDYTMDDAMADTWMAERDQ